MFLRKVPKKFARVTKFTGKPSSFQESFFKMSSWTRMWVLKPCFEFFRSKSEIFFSKNKKYWKIINFLNVFRKMIPWHQDWCFGSPAVNVLQKSETFPLKVQKLQKIKVFLKKNPQSLHLDTPNAVLTTLGEGFFPKIKNILVKVLRRWKNHNFSQKNCQFVSVDT